ncbi:MAG: hypothetical protein Q9227_001890 [Pyrenula ochraceoflavens]
MFSIILLFLLFTFICSGTAQISRGPVVADDFARYTGFSNSRTGVTVWQGIQYAKPPLPSPDDPKKNLRFRLPEDPDPNPVLQNNTVDKDICLTSGTSKSGGRSEDCLYLNVYAPTNSVNKKLPVVVTISGGGMQGVAEGYRNGTNLIKAADHGIVVVSFSYRVGIFGFLASSEIAHSNGTAALNVGLHDQRKAIEWVNKFIDRFGGDPDHIVLIGGSAGGGSVTYHLIGGGTSDVQNQKRSAGGGRNLHHRNRRAQAVPIFHGAIAQSPSSPPILDAARSDYQYQHVVSQLGCPSENSLSCLLSKTAQQLLQVSKQIPYQGDRKPPVYMWNPVRDDWILPDIPYKLFSQGKFVKVPTIFGSDSADGLSFRPNTTEPASGDADAVKEYISDYLKDNFPLLSDDQLQKLYAFAQQYPSNMNPNLKAIAGRLYGDMRYQCSSLFYATCAATFKNGNSNTVWAYQYNVHNSKTNPKPAVNDESVGHMAEHIWDDPDKLSQTDKQMQQHWINFIKNLNPNVNKANPPGRAKRDTVASWDNWDPTKPRRMVYRDDAAIMMELDGEQYSNRKAQCDYLSGISGGQNLGGIGLQIAQ